MKALVSSAGLLLSGCDKNDAIELAHPTSLFLALILVAALCLARRRGEPARHEARKPWSLTAEQIERGFAEIRNAIPVDDKELARAKPLTNPRQ